MIRAFKYRLHPSPAQEHLLLSWLRQCCALYNAGLEQKITAWKEHGRNVTQFDQFNELTDLRASDPTWSAVPALVQRSALRRLDLAFAAFFRRCRDGGKPGFPRFRSSRRYDSFSIRTAELKGERVYVPKLGLVKLNLYRPLGGEVRDVTLRRDTANRWWISFACDVGDAPPKVPVRTAIGIDLGLASLVTLSNGEAIPNPRYMRAGAELLVRRQRAYARKRRGSKSQTRAQVLVAKAHARVANQRLDHARKLAKEICDRFDLVAHEDLNIKGLASSRLAKAFKDASWGLLLRCLASKAEEAGKHLVPVDPRGTSQVCSSCGEVVTKTLDERTHRCACGLVTDRDHNAAVNILARGLRALEPDHPALKEKLRRTRSMAALTIQSAAPNEQLTRARSKAAFTTQSILCSDIRDEKDRARGRIANS